MTTMRAMEPSPAGGVLRIRVVDHPDEVRALLAWLEREDELRGRVSLAPIRQTRS
jgi:hypothetical protein